MNSGESDQRAGVRYDGHSELLDGLELPPQLVTLELEVRNALFRGVPNEPFAIHSEQLGRSAAGHFALTIQFENDQLARGLLGRSLELLEERYKVLVEFDGEGSHDCFRQQIVHPAMSEHPTGAVTLKAAAPCADAVLGPVLRL